MTDLDGVVGVGFDQRLGGEEAEVHLQRRRHAAHDGDGVLQAKLLQLETEGVLLVLQVDAGRRRQQLLARQTHRRRVGRLRRRLLVRQNVEVAQSLETDGSCSRDNSGAESLGPSYKNR